MTDVLLSGGMVSDNRQVSMLLSVVESSLGLIGPLLSQSRTHTSSAHTGFATISLLTYSTMENFTNMSFSGMTPKKGQRLQMNSKVVTVKVSNQDTDTLQEPVTLTFHHLQEGNNTICVYWDSEVEGGSWKINGCQTVSSDANYTVCSCEHLSSFAVLMALHDIEDPYEMQVFTWVGLTLSLVCLFLCILTFALIRSIQSPRNSIHLHLCLSLFVANLVFLCGISRTENKTGCAVVAGLLHYFYLAAFCWMCLEGIQLFRMVVLVFNTSFQTARMMAMGYGVPAAIVAISALVNSRGYGSEKHCWLNLEGQFIWSFFGPVCFVIAVNIFFFFITVWKLAQKFSSLNPELDNLRKIRAFTITAVAQLCVLGTTWIFGCFQFEKGPIAISYLFTILNSLQGVLLFVMHCLLSKLVREEYGRLFSSLSTPQKKKYSEFTSSHSSKAQTSKSNQDTGESHI